MARVQSLPDTRDSQDFLNALVEQPDVTEHVELPCESYSRWLTMSQAALLLRLHTVHTLCDAGCGDVVSSIVNFPHISREAVTYDIEPISNFKAQRPEFLLSPPLLSKKMELNFSRNSSIWSSLNQLSWEPFLLTKSLVEVMSFWNFQLSMGFEASSLVMFCLMAIDAQAAY